MKPSALEKLLVHDWPGNVRELVNVLQRAMLLAGTGPLAAEHLVLPEGEHGAIAHYSRAKAEFDARYYSDLLRSTGGNVSLVSRMSGKGRKEIYQVLRRLGIDADRFRTDAAVAEGAPLAKGAQRGRMARASGVRPAVRFDDDDDATGSTPEEGMG